MLGKKASPWREDSSSMSRQKRGEAAALLAFVALCLSACGALLPMAEAKYKFTTKGAPSILYDDFEENDGTQSTKYYYEAVENAAAPRVSRDWAASGEWSLRLEYDSVLCFSLDAPIEGTLSFQGRYSVYRFLLLIDGSESQISLSEKNDEYIFSAAITKGSHRIILSIPDGGENYIDDLSFVPFMIAASPADKTLFYTGQPDRLSWTACDSIAKYRVQIAEDAEFSSLILDRSDVADAEVALMPLPKGKTYFWRVSSAEDSFWPQWGPIRCFGLAGDPLDDSVEEILPVISSGDVVIATGCGTDGNSAIRIGHGRSGGSRVQLSLTLDSPQVLRFAIRQDQANYYCKTRLVIDTASYNCSMSTAWSYPTYSLTAGSHTLAWVADYGQDLPDTLIDSVSISDLQALVDDDLEPVASDTGTRNAWGFRGTEPPVLTEGAGRGGGRGIVFSTENRAFVFRFSELSLGSLIAEDCIVTVDYRNCHMPYAIIDGATQDFLGLSYSSELKADWNTIVFGVSAGAHDLGLGITHTSSDPYYASPPVVDNLRIIRYCATSANEGFESGNLSDNPHYINSYRTMIANSESPSHSGLRSLVFSTDSEGREASLVLPVDFTTPTHVAYWVLSDTAGNGFYLNASGEWDPNIPTKGIWTHYGEDIGAGKHRLVLNPLFNTRSETAHIYLDDLSFTPQ
jgi:hypothetical protein